MTSKLKSFILKTPAKSIKKFVIEHVENINVDGTNSTVNIMVDKKYSYNALHSTGLMEQFVEHIKNVYGKEYEVRFYTVTTKKAGNREMLIPKSVSYN